MEDDPEKLYRAACWYLAFEASFKSIHVVFEAGNLLVYLVGQAAIYVQSIL
jgi:hypothetical protein